MSAVQGPQRIFWIVGVKLAHSATQGMLRMQSFQEVRGDAPPEKFEISSVCDRLKCFYFLQSKPLSSFFFKKKKHTRQNYWWHQHTLPYSSAVPDLRSSKQSNPLFCHCFIDADNAFETDHMKMTQMNQSEASKCCQKNQIWRLQSGLEMSTVS